MNPPTGSNDSINADEKLLLASTEAHVQNSYHPPNHHHHQLSMIPRPPVEYVLNPDDRSALMDHNNRPITVDRMLATKPLQAELATRPGPGNRKLTYLSGESITRTLNDIFGYHGWNLDIKAVTRQECTKDNKNHKWHVAYMAHVRITLTSSGTYKEDMGAGDSIDRNLATASAHAMKASITDALKRAARHFGDKLGNSLYQGTFNINSAPKTLAQALDMYDQERAKAKFGKTTTISVKVAATATKAVPTNKTTTTTSNNNNAPPNTTAAVSNSSSNKITPGSSTRPYDTSNAVPSSTTDATKTNATASSKPTARPYNTSNAVHSVAPTNTNATTANTTAPSAKPVTRPYITSNAVHSIAETKTNATTANTTASSSKPMMRPYNASAARVSYPPSAETAATVTQQQQPPSSIHRAPLSAVNPPPAPALQNLQSMFTDASPRPTTSHKKRPAPCTVDTTATKKHNPYASSSV